MSFDGVPRPRTAFVLVALVLVCAFVGGARRASAHMPPPVFFTIEVDAEEVLWQMTVNAGIFEDWLPLQAMSFQGEGAGPPSEDARRAVEDLFAEYARVQIDRVEVKGTLKGIEATHYVDHGIPYDYVKLQVVYGTKGPPRQVAFAWTRYLGGLAGTIDWVESEIEGFGETQYFVFKAKEPEIVWHAPRTKRANLTPALPTVEPPPRLRLPLISLGLLLVLAVAVAGMHVARASRPVRWAGVGLVAALVLLFSGVAHTEVDLPFGERFERPSEEAALYDFESLLRNVYRAFDYDTEDAVYDTLARTVKGDLLEDIYLEIYGGLVLQEEGGAVSKVQKVEILEAEVLWPKEQDARYYRVRTRWQVTGKVGHWGHTHIRINEYRAVFTVALEGRAWKIAKLKLESKERLEDIERQGD